MTNTCKEFYREDTTQDIKLILERCLNESLWKNYELKCKISNDIYCSNEETYIFDKSDIAMGVFIIIIITANISGSLYDVIFVQGKNDKG